MGNSKIWFVTGASKGLGLALVKLLLSTGNKVAATTRNIAELESQVTENSENLLALKVDITQDEQVKQAIHQTVEKFGRLDVVVNNAGYGLIGSLEELTEQEFRQAMEVNVFAAVNVIRNAMPFLREQHSGHIINISSSAGYVGFGSAGSYNATKFAIIGLSDALAQEVKPFNVKVTVVAPGYFRTNFLEAGSYQAAQNPIPAYGLTQMLEAFQQMNGNQAGDPQKLVSILLQLVEEPNPPLHLLLGPDAYQSVLEKLEADRLEFEAWKHLSLSTNFDS